MFPIFGFSQKIKTKKDKILFDDKEIGTYQNSKTTYSVYDLKGNKQYNVELKGMSEGTTILSQWLLLTSADGTKTTEVPYEVTVTSLSVARIIFTLLYEKYDLLDSNGFDQNKIAAFFDTPRESLSDKALQVKANAIYSDKEKKEKVAVYNPFVKDNFNVVFGGGMSNNKVGYIKPSTYYLGSRSMISVYDLDNVEVAKATYLSNVDRTVKVELFNGDTFSYNSNRPLTSDKDTYFYTELVGELVYRDLLLGHQATQYKKDALQKRIENAKERSVNLYKVNGNLTDEKGIKYNGIVTAIFQKLDLYETGDIEEWNSIDNYGKKVWITYKNEKGNERTKSFMAKDNIRFYVDNGDGTQTAYQGMKVKGDAMKKLSNAMSLGFNNAYFYKELYTANGNTLLVDPVYPDIYIIKLKNKDEGQMLDNRNNDKLSDVLADYLSGCKSLSDEIRSKAFDLKVEDNLITIIDEYNECK